METLKCLFLFTPYKFVPYQMRKHQPQLFTMTCDAISYVCSPSQLTYPPPLTRTRFLLRHRRRRWTSGLWNYVRYSLVTRANFESSRSQTRPPSYRQSSTQPRLISGRQDGSVYPKFKRI